MTRTLPLLPLLFALLSACTPEPPGEDLCEAGEPRITAGYTGVSFCDDGTCPFGGASCETDADCFVPLKDGDIMPAWIRPQGGIGSALNLRIEGVVDDDEEDESDDDHFGRLRTLMTMSGLGDTCSQQDCATGGPCPCDLEGGEACLELPEGTGCVLALTDQPNQRFPTVCRGDGAIHIEEIHVRFLTGWTLEQVEGLEVDVEGHVEIDGELIRSDPIRVEFEVGEFQQPVSFTPGREG